jgi:formate-dependent nitrite reductase membrane component NrfD
VVGSILGLFVASYTGVLLTSTAVPVWARAKHVLGPLFLASGLSTALACLSCLLRRRPDMLERLERAETATLAAELSLISALPPLLGPLGKPLFQGRVGWLFKGGTIGGGLILPLLTRLGYKLAQKPVPPSLKMALSLLVLPGGFILRSVWIVAGRASADDPEAVHGYNALGSEDR